MVKVMWTVVMILIFAVVPPAAAQQAEPSRVPAVTGLDVLERAQAAFRAGDYADAVIHSSLFILLNPTFGQAYYLRGAAYIQLGDLPRALDDLKRTLDYPATNADFTGSVHNLRALLYLEQGDTDAALADLNAGISAAPEVAALYVTRAQVYRAQGRLDDALVDYDKALELDGDSIEARAGRAQINVQAEAFEAALADYSRILELDPQNGEAYALRAGVYLAQSQYDLALADLDAAVQLSPNAAGIYLSRGAANNALGRPAQAAADYLEWLNRVAAQRATFNGAFLPGESVVVPLEAGLYYRFSFEAKAGQQVRLTATGRPEQMPDPLLVLLDPAGSPVAADDDGGGGMNAQITYVVPADGTYTLLVGHAGGNPDGPVRVLLQIVR
ncbi:MAG: tetratricopeptide repeat protein [Chloroflexi bacterium]|nr:tetratricopeptide repeat protein [Chloroflexota bacterium]